MNLFISKKLMTCNLFLKYFRWVVNKYCPQYVSDTYFITSNEAAERVPPREILVRGRTQWFVLALLSV